MPTRLLKKIEIAERIVPALFLAFAWRLFGDDFFRPDAYAFTVFRVESFWFAVFTVVAVLTILATELCADDKNFIFYRPLAKLKSQVSDFRKFVFRLVMLIVCFFVWMPWVFGLWMQDYAGFGDIVWSGYALSTAWIAVRVYREPFKHEK